MSKKERNNILRIGKAARRQRERLLITSLEEVPGILIEHVEEVHSQPPSDPTHVIWTQA
ncbi:hypothetical protein ZA09C12_09110 [Escherichia coli]|nr:hypothetical protein VEE11_08840 [Escherichia coli]